MFIHCTVYVLIVLYVQRVDFHKWTQLMPDENLRVIYFYLKQVKVDKNNQYFILFKNVPQKEPISPCKFRYSHFLKVHFVTEENLHLQRQHNVVVVIYNPKHLCHKTIKKTCFRKQQYRFSYGIICICCIFHRTVHPILFTIPATFSMYNYSAD